MTSQRGTDYKLACRKVSPNPDQSTAAAVLWVSAVVSVAVIKLESDSRDGARKAHRETGSTVCSFQHLTTTLLKPHVKIVRLMRLPRPERMETPWNVKNEEGS